MLNYFLLQLVGPQRKSLSLKDPEKYEFRPKQLLKQVSSDYNYSILLIEVCDKKLTDMIVNFEDRSHIC